LAGAEILNKGPGKSQGIKAGMIIKRPVLKLNNAFPEFVGYTVPVRKTPLAVLCDLCIQEIPFAVFENSASLVCKQRIRKADKIPGKQDGREGK
jgi:hypothetical protein